MSSYSGNSAYLYLGYTEYYSFKGEIQLATLYLYQTFDSDSISSIFCTEKAGKYYDSAT